MAAWNHPPEDETSYSQQHIPDDRLPASRSHGAIYDKDGADLFTMVMEVITGMLALFVYIIGIVILAAVILEFLGVI